MSKLLNRLLRTYSVILPSLVLSFAAMHGDAASDPFAENVRTTEPLTSAQQAKTFRLPPGFEVDLVASEPQLAKPMNMAFDTRGRLWFTTSYEYPFPKKPGEPARDQIKILEDTDHDGRYDKVTTFAEGLNIPIGILPYGEGCIAWSIPNIYSFRDTDGDGKADQKEIVFGPLGWERDTHGNISSFRRGNDGWIYGTHGFNNNSTFKATDGSTITVNSGNTYRFKPDGSHIDQYTWGQVNPFGMCFDERGYFYTADCHSSPIYQLIPGGYYPSFGKPDDGLGFAPTTIQHSHGSTAIAGIVMIPEEGWPEEFRGNLFIGNVMTSRINRDRMEWRGSTPVGHEMPDFLSTDDPWFRPVDIQLGPDGALYIADFYNRIIGHYEVPLTHPGRDRERGRIWRVRYTGPGALPITRLDLTKLTPQELFTETGSGNPVRRSLALNELTDRVGAAGASLAKQMITSSTSSAFQKVGALWYLLRLDRLDAETLRSAGMDRSSLVRNHTVRTIGALLKPTPASLQGVLRALQDLDPHVQRAAAEALAQHPSPSQIAALLEAKRKVPPADTHLIHALRIALRNQFRSPGSFEQFTQSKADDVSWHEVAEVALAVTSPESAQFLLTHVQRHSEVPAFLIRVLKHGARFAGRDQLEILAKLTRRTFTQDPGQQLELLQAMKQGLAERGEPAPAMLRDWSTDLVGQLLTSAAQGSAGWQNLPMEGSTDPGNPWVLQERRTREGSAVQLISSLAPGGESLTGTLQSPEFTVPATLHFLIAGHDAAPDRPAPGKNRVQLREVGTGVILAQTPAPRTDVAQSVVWDLTAHEGKRGQVEVVDQDTGVAYAWIAAGSFEPAVFGWPVIAPRDLGSRLKAVTEVADSVDLTRLAASLQQLATQPSTEITLATTAARVLASQDKASGLTAIASLAGESLIDAASRRQLCTPLALGDVERCSAVVSRAMQQSPWRVQIKIAETYAGHPKLAEQLIDWIERSKASPRLLREPTIADRLAASLPLAADRVKTLLRNTPLTDQGIQKLIDDRRSSFDFSKSDTLRGAAVFAQSCAVCHKIEGAGNLIGPQLDGIGNRGVDRLCEDILDPNRNVDQAFRVQLIVLNDGEVTSGLARREEGDLWVMANSAGQEFSIPKKNIKERRDSANSLMPENFGELLTPADFNHLLGFLVKQAATTRQK